MIFFIELHNAGGNDVWVLARALDLSYYQKLSDVKLRKRVKDLEKLVPGATTTTPLSLVGTDNLMHNLLIITIIKFRSIHQAKAVISSNCY